MLKLLKTGMVVAVSLGAFAAPTLSETADWLKKKTIEMSDFRYIHSYGNEYDNYKAIIFIDAENCSVDLLERYKVDAEGVYNEFDEYVDYKSLEKISSFNLSKVDSVYQDEDTIYLSSDLKAFDRTVKIWHKRSSSYQENVRKINFGALDSSYAERYAKALRHAIELCAEDETDEPF